MKKILAFLTILLFATPLAKAAILKVQNLTDRPINVAIEGSWKNYNSLNTKIISPGQWGTFASAPLSRMGGPLKFAFTSDMEKNRYSFYETYSKKDNQYQKAATKKERNDFVRNYVLPTFSLSAIDIKGVQIKMNNDNVPVIRQSWPKPFLVIFAKHSWKALKKFTTKKDLMDW